MTQANQITAANRRGPLQFVADGHSSVSLRCSCPAHSPVAEFYRWAAYAHGS
jgi:hypothetical protein